MIVEARPMEIVTPAFGRLTKTAGCRDCHAFLRQAHKDIFDKEEAYLYN
jgi:hypothetical protein